MRRFLPSRQALPLCAAALLLAALLPFLWHLPLRTGLRAVLLVADVAVLAAVLDGAHRLRVAERLVAQAECIAPEQKHLPFIAQLNLLLDETASSGRRQYTAAIADTQAEISALQSQINPHFLYNTLDAIRGQALIDNSPVIADMTEALSVLFRYSISREGSLATLQEELRSTEKYLMLQQFRFGGKLSFDKEVDAALLSCLIPRLSLQPIVENAIFHGLETQETHGVITLQLYRTGACLVVRICDNGVGMSAEQVTALNETLRLRTDTSAAPTGARHSGIALTNVNRRIWLTFGAAYGLQVLSMPGVGTDVELLLPCITSPEELGRITEAAR